MKGIVMTVEVYEAKTYLSEAVEVDDVELVVADGTPFGSLDAQAVVAGVTYDVTSVKFGAGSDDPDVLALGTPVTVTAESGEPVVALPATTVTSAEVLLEGADDTVWATVEQKHQSKVDLLPGPTTEPRPIVDVEVLDGRHVIKAIDGRGLDDAGALTGDLPQEIIDQIPTGGGPSEAPTAAPTFTVTPHGIGVLKVDFPGIDPALLPVVEVAASLSSPVAEDGSDTIGTSTGSTFFIASVDGAQIPFTAPTYVKVRVTNGLGDGPWSVEKSATPRQADNDFISSLYAYLGTIEAGRITSGNLDAAVALLGQIAVGSLIEIKPPTSVSNGAGGFTLLGGITILDPANPSGEPLVRLHPGGCTFRGKLVADIVTVLQDLVINGNARISGGSTFSLTNGVPDPLQGPTWTVGPQTAQSWPAAPSGYVRSGFAWDSANGRWFELLARTSNNRAYVRTVSTAGVAGSLVLLGRTLPSGGSDLGIVRGMALVGSTLFYGWQADAGSTSPYYVSKTDFSGALQAQSAALPGNLTTVGPHGASDVTAALVLTGASSAFHLSALRLSGSTLAETDRLAPGTTWAVTGSDYPTSIAVGAFDYGAERVVISTDGGFSGDDGARVFVADWTADTVTQDSAQAWAFQTNVDTMLAWNGTNFLTTPTTTAAANLTRWSGFRPSGSDAVWSAVYQDLTSTGHTASSPATTASVPARNYVTLTLPSAPAGVTGSDVWVGYATSGNAATKYKRSETLSGRTLMLTGKNTTGSTTIPSGSTAGGSPAIIKSDATPGWKGAGDGTFEVKTPTSSLHAANMAYVDTAVASTEWGAREDITAKVSGATATVLDIRRRGKDRELRFSVTRSLAVSDTQDFIASGNPLAAGDRPSFNSFAFAYIAGGYPGSAWVRSNGTVAIVNMSTATRSGAHQGTIRYSVE